MNRRMVTGALSALLIVAGLTACQPPARAQLVVDTTADGSDSDPGDGVCASDTAGGGCTVQAAVEEANALGKADITLPAGLFSLPQMTITGNVAIFGAGITQTLLGGSLTVAPQGSVRVDAIGTGNDLSSFTFLSFQVNGSLHVTRSLMFTLGPPIQVGTTGGAVIENSTIGGIWGGPAIRTAGNVVVDRSTLHAAPFSDGSPPLNTVDVVEGGAAGLRASWISSSASCSGTPPTSLGYNHSTDPTCGLSAVGDGTGESLTPLDVAGWLVPPPVDSALVDAIPLGTGTCVEGATDALGNARGVDGNLDGVGGCDIGAVELQLPA